MRPRDAMISQRSKSTLLYNLLKSRYLPHMRRRLSPGLDPHGIHAKWPSSHSQSKIAMGLTSGNTYHLLRGAFRYLNSLWEVFIVG